jgi:hypothetical protein
VEYSGEFETHITVHLEDPQSIAALRVWGKGRGLKCIHIVLDRGVTVSQPMLTRRGRGTLSGELAAAMRVAGELNAGGVPVIRVKLEAAPWNQDVPQSIEEAAGHSDLYFEHHVKLLLPSDADTSRLAITAEQHGSHLSRNALRLRQDGHQERFVTQRCRNVGRDEARKRLDDLLNAITPFRFAILDVEEEYVVFDSNIGVDAGWLSDEL